LYPMKALLAARLRQFSSGVRRSCLWSNGILGFSMAVSDIWFTLPRESKGRRPCGTLSPTVFRSSYSSCSCPLLLDLYEAMQILAFLSVSKKKDQMSERGEHPMAMRTCELLFRGEGSTPQGFVCGGHIHVTFATNGISLSPVSPAWTLRLALVVRRSTTLLR
jgi:hypothetical protein